jgi:hypothetical protein
MVQLVLKSKTERSKSVKTKFSFIKTKKEFKKLYS